MTSPTSDEIIKILEQVKDPEIDVINIVELGIVREALFQDGKVRVTITPTYSGCPAMQMIEDQVRQTLREAGYQSEIVTTYSPPWSTDWIADEAREKLRKYGISPPGNGASDKLVSIGGKIAEDVVTCPLCSATQVKCVSEFGSTACKALYTCLSCKQPFEHFKRI